MAYNTKYRIEFGTIKNKNVKIDIQENAFGGSITNLKGANATLSYSDGDRSKLHGLRRSSLTFGVYCADIIDPQIFLTQTGIELKVKLYYDDILSWVGWVDNYDLQIQFRDQISVSVKASDGLHLLENAKLVNLSGNNLWDEYFIKDYITFCLNKTELGLNFWTWIDIYPISTNVRGAGGDTLGANDPLNQASVHSLTFQKGGEEYYNPFEVLQKICDSFKMTGFQSRGEWHFVYTEDWIRNLGLTGTQWNASGTALQYLSNQRHRVDIGLNEIVKFKNNDALITFQNIHKSARLKFQFDIPTTQIRNMDFTQGTPITVVPAAYQTMDLKYWGYTGTQPLIYTSYDTTSLETTRYIKVSLPSGGGQTSRFTSYPFPCNANDKFTFKIKYTPDYSNSRIVFGFHNYTIAQNYYLKPDGKWTGNTMTTTLIQIPGILGTEYQIETVVGVPVDGYLELILGVDGINSSASITFIESLEFSYEPYISPNMTASGHYYQSEQETTSRSVYDEEVFISDSLNKAVKGCLVNDNGIKIPFWKHKGITEEERFGRIITRALWKNLYRNFYRLEGTGYGISDGSYLISPLNTIIPNIQDTEFNIATLNIDFKNESCELTMVELLNTSTSDDFDEQGTESFRHVNIIEEEIFKEENKNPFL